MTILVGQNSSFLINMSKLQTELSKILIFQILNFPIKFFCQFLALDILHPGLTILRLSTIETLV